MGYGGKKLGQGGVHVPLLLVFNEKVMAGGERGRILAWG